MKTFRNIVFALFVVAGLVAGGYFVIKNFAKPLEKTVTFDLNGGTVDVSELEDEDGVNYVFDVSNKTASQNLLAKVTKTGAIELPTSVTKTGYTFDGWFFQDEQWSSEDEITQSITLKAKWTPIKVPVHFSVDGNVTTKQLDYDSTPTFDSYPTKARIGNYCYVFDGWDPAFSVVKEETTYTAKFKKVPYNLGEEHTVSLVVDGTLVKQLTTIVGENLSEIVLDGNDVNKPDEYVVSWFIDKEKTQVYSFDDAPVVDITLYGSWIKVLDDGFFNYYDKFSKATPLKALEINSHEEFLAYFEYVHFYSITNKTNVFENQKISLSYISDLNMQKLESEIKILNNQTTMPLYAQTQYQVSGDSYAYIYASTKTADPSKVIDSEKTQTYPQQTYVMEMKITPNRSSDCSFAVDKITKTIEVEYSNQLVYALEKGYKPICKAGSNADSVYNKAKTVLRQICTDQMTCVEKLRAIYEWIILNVQYDNQAANKLANASDWQCYDSWYAEGVFNNKKAVCDGISKAFLIMAKIEGIPTIRVLGSGHAWNKVYIDGKWFCVDATQGNLIINSKYEALSYADFLFSDEYMREKNYEAENNLSFEAVSKYNVYEKIENKKNNFDLYINSRAELVNLLNYFKSQTNTLGSKYVTIEFKVQNGVLGTSETVESIYSEIMSGKFMQSKRLSQDDDKVYLYMLEKSA